MACQGAKASSKSGAKQKASPFLPPPEFFPQCASRLGKLNLLPARESASDSGEQPHDGSAQPSAFSLGHPQNLVPVRSACEAAFR